MPVKSSKNTDSVNTATETEVKKPLEDDGYKLTDGGEIIGGWAPQLSEKHSKFSVTETTEKKEKGKVVSVADSVKGTFALGSAWNKNCYLLEKANDGEKDYESLRLPESAGLFNALARFAFGAELKIVYGGTVKVPKGYAHKWDVYCKNPETHRLTSPRADALKTLSEAQKEHLEALEKANSELDNLAMKVELRQIENKKQRMLLAVNDTDTVDAEFERASDDFAFGMNLDPKSKK